MAGRQIAIKDGLCLARGSHLTFTDVVLAKALSAYLGWVPDVLKAPPLLVAVHEKVLSAPGIAHSLHSAQKYPMAENDDVIDIASVLQRALPSICSRHTGLFPLGEVLKHRRQMESLAR